MLHDRAATPGKLYSVPYPVVTVTGPCIEGVLRAVAVCEHMLAHPEAREQLAGNEKIMATLREGKALLAAIHTAAYAQWWGGIALGAPEQ